MRGNDANPAQPIDDTQFVVDEATFAAAYGEPLTATLDLDTWDAGDDLSGLYQRIEQEIQEAVTTENAQREIIRKQIVPRLRERSNAPPDAGLYRASLADLQQVHRKVLFNGAAEVCDGTSLEYDTLPVTITQIGVCLLSYQGGQQSFVQRLFRRDLRAKSADPLQDVLALMDNRRRRGSMDGEEGGRLSNLARRGIMTYAERAILTHKSTAPWRIGHGNPAPYELLTGSGSMDLLQRSMEVLRELVLHHRKILFVPSAPARRHLLMLGQALEAREYLLFETAEESMLGIVDNGHYSTQWQQEASAFCKEVGPKLMVGVYRAAEAAPPCVFYSHIAHAHEAAHIAIADSLLQEHRGFPLLIDLADRLCRTAFGNDIFHDAIQTAYANAGAPFRYLSERQTRD